MKEKCPKKWRWPCRELKTWYMWNDIMVILFVKKYFSYFDSYSWYWVISATCRISLSHNSGYKYSYLIIKISECSKFIDVLYSAKKMRKNAAIGGFTSRGKGRRILPLAFLTNSLENWFGILPWSPSISWWSMAFARSPTAYGWWKKKFLSRKDDSRNPRHCLALKGQDYSDISLFENWKIILAKVSRRE